MTKLLRILTLLILGLGLVLSIPQRAVADEDDPPGRAARLGYTQGPVSFKPAGTEDWVSAVVNRPITTGDRLWTDKGARAELNTGSAAIRLGSETGFSFLNLTDNMTQIRLSQGVLNIHLHRLDQNEAFEVDTPNLAFSLLRPGDYRLEVNEAGDATAVTVHGGEGEVTAGGQAFSVHPNQRATFTGTDQVTANLDSLGNYDEFDRWCRDRNDRQDRAPSARYVSRDVVGYQDLDDYGYWRTVPDYGPMWVPRRVVAGWAPYRYGHWVWISPWGWTWVDDAPWGFAPFHYGRWAYIHGTWGWCPGPVAVVRPVYAPALVAWVGGPHFSIGIGVGGVGAGVGWFPLGPREVYVPPYRVSRAYVTNVNITNTTVNNTYVTNVYNNYSTNNANVTNIKYVNRNAPGAVTATSQTAFASAQPIQRNIVKVDERQLAQTRITTSAGVVPQQRSVLGAGTSSARPPSAVHSRTVVARTAPPPAPAAFSKQQQALQSNGGRPLGRQEAQRLVPQGRQSSAPVRVMQSSGKPVPVDSATRTRSIQSQQPNGSYPAPVPPPSHPQVAPNQPVQQAPPQISHIRDDRPPSTQSNRTQLPSNAKTNSPDRPSQNAPDAKMEQKLQQQQQLLKQQQQQESQRLEQKHQQQLGQAQQQAENQRQQQEHQKLQQKHQQQAQKLDQNQQQQRQKAQKQPKPQ
jgi:Family of unknown function (DUF6600)